MGYFIKPIIILAIILNVTACTSKEIYTIDKLTGNSAQSIKEFNLLQQLDADGIESVSYIDEQTICISAYKKGRNEESGYWELILAVYNFTRNDLNIFYRGVESTDYLRNITTAEMANGDISVFNGATIFFLDKSGLKDSITLDERYRRETTYSAEKNALAMVNPSSFDLCLMEDGSSAPTVIYEASRGVKTLGVRVPYAPVFSPSGEKILFQIGGETALSLYEISCYDINSGTIIFTLPIEQKSDVIECMWMDNDTFITLEPAPDDASPSWITGYNSIGEPLYTFPVDGPIMQLRAADPARVNLLSVLIYDGYDEQSDELLYSIATTDLISKKTKTIYHSDTVVFSHDLSPDGRKIVWVEGTVIKEIGPVVPKRKSK